LTSTKKPNYCADLNGSLIFKQPITEALQIRILHLNKKGFKC
jgi:hypothetical protein